MLEHNYEEDKEFEADYASRILIGLSTILKFSLNNQPLLDHFFITMKWFIHYTQILIEIGSPLLTPIHQSK